MVTTRGIVLLDGLEPLRLKKTINPPLVFTLPLLNLCANDFFVNCETTFPW
jgi:hypothetical protein